MTDVATSVAVPPPMASENRAGGVVWDPAELRRIGADADDAVPAAPAQQVVDDRGGTGDLVVRGGVAVAAVFLAHDLDRQAAAQRHVLGADVAGKRRRFLHAEVEQYGLVAAALDQMLDEDDVLAARVQVADDDDALACVHVVSRPKVRCLADALRYFPPLAFFTSGRVSRLTMPATGLVPLKPYSFQRSETFCSTARSMKISFGLLVHS